MQRSINIIRIVFALNINYFLPWEVVLTLGHESTRLSCFHPCVYVGDIWLYICLSVCGMDREGRGRRADADREKYGVIEEDSGRSVTSRAVVPDIWC